MRVAQVTKYFHPHRGGIESHVLGISEGFARRGHEVLVFTSDVPGAREGDELDGIKVFRSPVFFTLFNGPFAPGILNDLLREDYDLIHAHLPDPFNSVFALIASKIKKKPLFVTYHADIIKNRWYHRPFKFVYCLFLYSVLSNAVKIMPTTPNYVVGSQIPEKFKKKIEVVHNFVDLGKFSPMLYGKRVRTLYGLDDNKKIVFFLGRLVPYKGVEYLIKAFKKVKDEVKDSVLIIAGRGPLEEDLQDLAKDLKLSDVLFVEISDDDIPEHYAACDVFVLPSVTRQEAFGIALLEAMACGKAVVTTNISGMPYVVDGAGLMVKPRDPDELSAAIIKLLKDDKLRKNLGSKARKRVEEEFDQDLIPDRIIRIYKSR
jgi:glycosyltransferase involved in cell wall biosynthesis